jgi:hypothetical protein
VIDEIDKNRHGALLSIRIDGSIAKSTKTVSARIFVERLGAAICRAVSEARTLRTKCRGKMPG